MFEQLIIARLLGIELDIQDLNVKEEEGDQEKKEEEQKDKEAEVDKTTGRGRD